MVPPNNQKFISQKSKEMAATEKSLTYEFLMECLNSYAKYPDRLRYLSLIYVTPWINNIAEIDSAEKITEVLTKLVDLVVEKTAIDSIILLQSEIWETLGQQEACLPQLLQILIERAGSFATGSVQSDDICSVIVSLSSNDSMAKAFIACFKKELKKFALEDDGDVKATSETRMKNVCIMTRFLANLSFNNALETVKYYPDLCFIIMQVVGIGSSLHRRTLHAIIVNIIHNLADQSSNTGPTSILSISMIKLSDPKYNALNGLDTGDNTRNYTDFDLKSYALKVQDHDKEADQQMKDVTWTELEFFGTIFWEIILGGAPSPGNLL